MNLRGVRCYIIHLFSGRTDFCRDELGVGTGSKFVVGSDRRQGTWTADALILLKTGEAGDAALAKEEAGSLNHKNQNISFTAQIYTSA